MSRLRRLGEIENRVRVSVRVRVLTLTQHIYFLTYPIRYRSYNQPPYVYSLY
jgi:hypothetical protein